MAMVTREAGEEKHSPLYPLHTEIHIAWGHDFQGVVSLLGSGLFPVDARFLLHLARFVYSWLPSLTDILQCFQLPMK